jgi:AAA+ superfamily predicted ATPase
MPDESQANANTKLPDWYPDWARELADRYFSGTTCVFVLHGNVHDLIRMPDANGDGERYGSLVDFLGTSLFGSWDVVMRHDLSHGLRAVSGGDSSRLQTMMQTVTSYFGQPEQWPKTPDDILAGLDAIIERNLLESNAVNRKSVGLLFEFAQYLMPASDMSSLAGRQGARLVRFLQWAQNPYIKRTNVAFCLVADKLSDLNDRLVQSPHVATIEIPMPDEATRESYIRWRAGDDDLTELTDFTPEQLAGQANGLTLTNVDIVLSQAKRSSRRVDGKRFRKLKKSAIERQCQGLLEFIEPSHTLDLVVGHDAAKKRLREDAGFLADGRLDAAPMGYLICGPVGTGKTFMAECYAGSIGIPCVVLKNFRSKYVGETEGNLERVLSVLRSLGPVIVIIDEADAALGNRTSSGDSGTSSRVFSMIASQMGNTRYRGKILWMLLTSRPDLLPIDLKRQGRAEVHIPLFYPDDVDELKEMFRVMARKNDIDLSADAAPEISVDGSLSGADIEGILLAAKRNTLTAGETEVDATRLGTAFESFIPSSQGLEKEMQEIAAVLECTQRAFLPERWRKVIAKPNGRSELQNRLVSLRAMIDE